MRHVLTVDDVSDEDVDRVLSRASELADGASPLRTAPLLATMFLSPSVRTRVGFSAAAVRLGGASVDASELRFGPAMSKSETFDDALRIVSGMVDVVVVRVPFRLDGEMVTRVAQCPVVNGGDEGGEHPSQALIDLAAIERFAGPVGELRIGLCGDLGMRAVSSLLRLLERRPPAALRLMAPEHRGVGVDLGRLADRSEISAVRLDTLDVLYLPGLPAGGPGGRLDDEQRAAYALTGRRLAEVDKAAVVLCPLPVIDEVDDMARTDPRIRMFEQSDHAVHVRTALLEILH